MDFDNQARSGVRDLGADELCTAVVDDLIVPDQSVSGAATEEACDSITAAAYVIESTGVVTFQPGIRILLQNGFTILDGGTFSAVIAVP